MIPSTLAEAAIYYSKNGWKTVPLHHIEDGNCTCIWERKPECRSAGKHPLFQEWEKHAAFSDHYIAEANWYNSPKANIGILTGPQSGVVVLDIDTDLSRGKVGTVEFARLCSDYNWQPDPNGPRARSGSGGIHYWFAHPGVPIGNVAKIADGKGGRYKDVDFRGDNGQVVVAPSVATAGAYSWVIEPWTAPFPTLPPFLIKLINETPVVSNKSKIAVGNLNHDEWLAAGAPLPPLIKMMMATDAALMRAVTERKSKSNDGNPSVADAAIMGRIKSWHNKSVTVADLVQTLWWSWRHVGLTTRHNQKGSSYYESTCSLGGISNGQPTAGRD